jgi:hypothetical protein
MIKKFFELKIYKGLNLALLAIVVAIVLYIQYYYDSGLCLERCTYEFMAGFLDPLNVASQSLLMTLTLLLFLPGNYFRRWLWYVASWAIPVSLIIVLNESEYAMGLMSGRTFLAKALMDILFAVSIAFVVGTFIFNKIQSAKKS